MAHEYIEEELRQMPSKTLARTSPGADGLDLAVTPAMPHLGQRLRESPTRVMKMSRGDVKLSQPIYYLPWKVVRYF